MSALPTVPIIDGVVRVPAVMEAAVLRVVSMEENKQIKRSSIYEPGMELLAEEGTILEILGNGNQVILSVECRKAEAKPAPASAPVAPAQEEPQSDTVDLAKLPFDQRLGYRAHCYYGKPFSALSEEEKTECMIKPDPTAAEIEASQEPAPEPEPEPEIERPNFIAPPDSPLEASKALKAELESDVQALKDLEGTAEDLQTYQDVMKNLAAESGDNEPEATSDDMSIEEEQRADGLAQREQDPDDLRDGADAE